MSGYGNVAAIFQKEWRHYFGSPIAWVALCVWTLLFGFFFDTGVWFFQQQSAQAGMSGRGLSVNDYLMRNLFHNMAVVAMFIVPMLTMRLFAEEKRQGTMELLATVPLTDAQILIGKFLAALAVFGLMILATLLNVLQLWRYATPTPDWKPIATGVLGLLLLGGCYIALGAFLSNLTRNQVVAATISFCLLLGFLVLEWFTRDPMGSTWKKVLGYLALGSHMDDMVKGVIGTDHLIFYLSFIGFFLFLTQQSLASQRWRA
jgi:gliding motility-associated transport system permease protein